LRRLPMSRTEKTRLDREDLDAKGFVSQLERLLIVADESANGKFASRLAGFIAGQRGKPMTVLHLTDVGGGGTKKADAAQTKLKEVAAHSATQGNRAATEEMNEERPNKVEVSARQEEKESDGAVSDEAEKGYDLLFAGIEHMYNRDGSFPADIDQLGRVFDGPLVLAFSGVDGRAFEEKRFHILLPVNGTEASRRGAEIALTLAPVKDSTITALHIGRRAAHSDTKRGVQSAGVHREAAKAVLGDVVTLARRYGYRQIETASQVEAAPEKAIIEQAERSGANLIVMGASRRVGESLYLGETVDGVLQGWKGALVLVVM
jgi:nucleotide-binding universal stress UspA family protein